MPLIYDKTLVRFEDACTVEEALALQEWLGRTRSARVDLSACTHLHAALLQVLLAGRPKLAAPPTDPFLARWIAPHLDGGSSARKGGAA